MEMKPKRKWFRFHLLTIVFGSFVAGGILYLNTRWNTGEIRDPEYIPVPSMCGLPMTYSTQDYGWPEKFYRRPPRNVRFNPFLWRPFILDVAVFVSAMVVTSFGFERVFFRRTT